MALLRLVRPLNLFIIACTMYSTRLFFYLAEERFSLGLRPKAGEPTDFFLLVFSTVLIAAAGNIINDYFDVKADRVNKPERVIIGKYIKRRWAIILHWTLNLSAFAIAVYLGFQYRTFWYVFIHLLSINSLWFYSMLLKRRLLSGNLIVAGLTALVPVLCGVHFYVQNSVPDINLAIAHTTADLWLIRLADHGIYILLLGYFAFFGNLAREIIKDVQDEAGDRLLPARTLAIVAGKRNALRISALILAFCPVFYISMMMINSSYGVLPYSPCYTLPVDLAVAIQLVCIFLLISRRAENFIKLSERLIKLSMLCGILWPVYWFLIF